MCLYLQQRLHNTVLKNKVKRPRRLSCLYIMRTTFLLPLARMLAAFYRAIKAVNQSLLNDPCFLTCFTGGCNSSSRAPHTWLCSPWPAPTQSAAVWTVNTLCDKVIASPEPGLRAACVQKEQRKDRGEEEEGGGEGGAQTSYKRGGESSGSMWYFSCPCIPVETHLRLLWIHTNSVLQGTYRQLTCFGEGAGG